MREQIQPQRINNEKDNKKVAVKCKFCKAQNYIKKGFRKTKERGKIQKYKCLSCNRYFTADFGFYRMRNSESKITQAIDLYFSNLSSRKVRNHFGRHLEHNTSHVTVLDWCRKYVLKIQKYIDKLQPELSGKFYADETCIKRNKKNDLFWCNVDWDTRFINGFHYSRKGNIKEAITFLKKVTKNQTPSFIQSDYAPFYPKAMRKLFYTNYKNNNAIIHFRNNTQKTRKHNVRIETVFMKIKDRVDDFRGLKALWSAPILLNGIIIQHNFIEQHTTIRDYPCSRAGLDLELGLNRWLGLIKIASN